MTHFPQYCRKFIPSFGLDCLLFYPNLPLWRNYMKEFRLIQRKNRNFGVIFKADPERIEYSTGNKRQGGSREDRTGCPHGKTHTEKDFP